MKGVTFITDETHNKRYVQIDMEELEKNQNQMEDLLDALVAEGRKDDEEVSWEELKAQAKSDGRL